MTGNAVVTLKKGEGRTLKAGGMWIYDNEIDNVTGNFAEGDIISVRDFDGYFRSEERRVGKECRL